MLLLDVGSIQSFPIKELNNIVASSVYYCSALIKTTNLLLILQIQSEIHDVH